MKTFPDGAPSALGKTFLAKFNPSSPEYKRYINGFHDHSHELTSIFVSNPDILLSWDNLMNEFNTNDLSTDKVSEKHRVRMKGLLDEIYVSASPSLQDSIIKHRYELDHFPDTMTFLMFSFYFF
jgi:hypothetical protein